MLKATVHGADVAALDEAYGAIAPGLGDQERHIVSRLIGVAGDAISTFDNFQNENFKVEISPHSLSIHQAKKK